LDNFTHNLLTPGNFDEQEKNQTLSFNNDLKEEIFANNQVLVTESNFIDE